MLTMLTGFVYPQITIFNIFYHFQKNVTTSNKSNSANHLCGKIFFDKENQQLFD